MIESFDDSLRVRAKEAVTAQEMKESHHARLARGFTERLCAKGARRRHARFYSAAG